ncbi:MAG: ChrR family anti-sigma-E factor [Gammaproteobacteria bacterium]|nr:ChrR family anti-sigma-E factor [Gammaproteobacteria bacterium]MXW69336.1 transcriptional regulator [Acidimicrobiia bacterium]MCY3689887.1 ChrR family anti-sigma-E factor [Gammaproteobacteria bacterium]MDE0479629.1 ChrR family anti-sigma-E factor [Gammaproteobacteria bacterium]MDE0507851.1 ChrR family anti-sigma-E factor [Gammaproteobacteria bacterium]
MNESIAHHPAEDMLESFARRELSTGASVIVSAHLEMCNRCRARVAEFESREMREWNAEPEPPPAETRDFDGMIERIVSLPRQDAETVATPVDDLQAAGFQESFVKDLRLPRALRQAAARLRWTCLTEGIHQAIAPIDRETRCEFIYMAAGASTPVHTHYGREYTLILQGRFHDELGSYGNGDFLFRDASHEHQPASENGCLSFAVLDRPLRFTRGLPRLMNPINRLRFRGVLAR